MNKQNWRYNEKKKYSWVEFAITIEVSVAGFAVAHEYAALERGYEAIGGELMFLCLPILYFVLKEFIS